VLFLKKLKILHLSAIYLHALQIVSKLSQKITYPVENGSIQTTELLTPTEMAYTLEITEYALQVLVHNETIPHTYIQSYALWFYIHYFTVL
jgi:hypothetical protein